MISTAASFIFQKRAKIFKASQKKELVARHKEETTKVSIMF